MRSKILTVKKYFIDIILEEIEPIKTKHIQTNFHK